MSLGFKALEISANAQEPEGAEPISKKVWGFTIMAALALAVGLFFLVPFGLTYLIKGWLNESSFLFWLVDVLGWRKWALPAAGAVLYRPTSR